MNFKSFSIILGRQLKQKWLRVMLASAGITIGVWAITATTGITLGIRDTVVTAINSQAAAREIRVYSLDGATSFAEVTGAPTFKPVSRKDLDKIVEGNENIISASPSEILGVRFKNGNSKTEASCYELNQRDTARVAKAQMEILEQAANGNSNSDISATDFEDLELYANCAEVSIISNSFENFYLNHQNDWYGQATEPKNGEIVVCMECGGIDFAKSYGVENPEDFVGKTIKMEFATSPDAKKINDKVDAVNFNRDIKPIQNPEIKEMKVVAVIDDRGNSDISFTGTSENNFYLNFDYFEEAILAADPTINLDEVGYIENVVLLDSYDNYDSAFNYIQNQGFVPFSVIKVLIDAINGLFIGLTVALSLLGIIAFLVSIFGIILVMIISVLERKKEIGILKSLGARNRDIFFMFVVESSILGVVGWIFGTLFAFLTGLIVSFGVTLALNSFDSVKQALESVNITSFDPYYPVWLFLTTLIVSVVVTAISGLLPAIKAANQNPVDVLRSE